MGIAAAVALGAPTALNFDHFCGVFLRIYDRNAYDRISLLNKPGFGYTGQTSAMNGSLQLSEYPGDMVRLS